MSLADQYSDKRIGIGQRRSAFPQQEFPIDNTGGCVSDEQMVIHEAQSFAKPEALTPMGMLQIALQNNAAIDVIERLAALQEKAQARDAEQQFNEAMNAAQAELGRVAPNLENPQTHSRYASYAALDRVVRPIYTKHGFSLSFDTADAPREDAVRTVCYVSHKAGHSRRYQVDMPADGKGAKGGDVMTKTHAAGAAMSYGARYLLKYIFNIAVGEDDTDGNLTNGELQEKIEWIANAGDPKELAKIYADAYNQFEESPAAIKALIAAKKARKQEKGWL